jgi:hypothetical protein
MSIITILALFQVALRFTFVASARFDAVEVAIDIKLKKYSGMISRSASDTWINSCKPQLAEVKLLDKDINYTNRVIFSNVVISCSGSNIPWVRSSLLMNRFIYMLQQMPLHKYIKWCVFTQPGSGVAFQVSANRSGVN